MRFPSEYKDIQKLTGCLAVLSRFISKSGERNLPFFKNLIRASSSKFYWDDQCSKPFEELKEYLDSSKLLSQPEQGELLQLYLAVSSRAIYFESHPIQVVTDQQLKKVITSPQLSGRLTTWTTELSEFDITYVPRTSIKAQALADFVIECTAPTPHMINGSGNGELGREKPE
ncbi:hypothetical protein LIER_37859 [Lithospermum erythrorhizon]|uniref:Uncharacterized protein n=1 Tax=Lithospermum erythrorhizon TaxID=34254 RepID=A0AAV3PTF9_LITER